MASCPPLHPLADDSFGATSQKLIDVAAQYGKCRRAAIGEEGAANDNAQSGGNGR